ncbi:MULTISPECIES: 2-oxoglutarate and iron-dependent oxygenase domain-containing protein [unclassified Pseudomonas]|uniref:2-oxoglutarate and iron-dependent oxygenase domain-containing protein n=1 Tax=unclassified Pseudomonas TaxID=196821 RepID=UPI00385ED212
MTDLHTFVLPERITGSSADKALGHALINAWQTDGIFQIASTTAQELALQSALQASKRFFKMPHAEKPVA